MKLSRMGQTKYCSKCGKSVAYKDGKFKPHRKTFSGDSPWCVRPKSKLPLDKN